MSVEVVHWNPARPLFAGRVGRRLPVRKRVNNFGDLLGPLIVSRVLQREGLKAAPKDQRLLAVGSILRLARDNDTLWGIGANGKSLNGPFNFARIDVRALRGPLTQKLLADMGIQAPAVYGDPALLIPELWTERELGVRPRSGGTISVPNMHDYSSSTVDLPTIKPTDRPLSVIREIASSTMVVGSSLHGVIVAEAFGVPARFIRSGTEPLFKYHDYLQGTGRFNYEFASDVADALRLGPAEPPTWDSKPLLEAFPRDLWRKSVPN